MARKVFLSNFEAERLLGLMNISKEDLETPEPPAFIQNQSADTLLAKAILRDFYNIGVKS